MAVGGLLSESALAVASAQCPLSADCLPRSEVAQNYLCINENSLFASKYDFPFRCLA
jgi:hypothetical protein